jgi:hypothetical protein
MLAVVYIENRCRAGEVLVGGKCIKDPGFIVEFYPKGNWRDWKSVRADTVGFINDEGKPKIAIFSNNFSRGFVVDSERVIHIRSAAEQQRQAPNAKVLEISEVAIDKHHFDEL